MDNSHSHHTGGCRKNTSGSYCTFLFRINQIHFLFVCFICLFGCLYGFFELTMFLCKLSTYSYMHRAFLLKCTTFDFLKISHSPFSLRWCDWKAGLVLFAFLSNYHFYYSNYFIFVHPRGLSRWGLVKLFSVRSLQPGQHHVDVLVSLQLAGLVRQLVCSSAMNAEQRGSVPRKPKDQWWRSPVDGLRFVVVIIETRPSLPLTAQ